MTNASRGAVLLDEEAAPRLDAAPAYVPPVDGLRGGAALLVLLYHCWVFTDPPLDGGALRALAACGALGVDFFFVISGFVLFLPVARRGTLGSVRGYLVRRVARIVPAYYASLLLQALAVPLLTPFATPFASAGGWLVLVAHLLFLQHELPASLARAAGFRGDVLGFGVNGVVWSLSIEALFYVTLPVVAGSFSRRPLVGLVGALLATAAWRTGVAALGGDGAREALIDQFPSFLAHFAFGMCGALLYVRLWPDRRRRAAALLVAQVVSLPALLLAMASYGNLVATTPFGPAAAVALLPGVAPALFFATLLVSSALAPRGAGTLLATPAARWLGDVSYGVFLWHLPVVLAVLRWTPLVRPRSDAGFVVLCALVVPVSLLLGWLSRRFVEEPAIRWARERSGGEPQAARR